VEFQRGRGTGFFIAPGVIVTCHHVLAEANAGDTVPIIWGQEQLSGVFEPLPHPEEWDLALLRITDMQDHPCVLFHEDASIGDKLYCFGYTRDYQNGEPAIFECEGESRQPIMLKLKTGQAQFGMSGAPLLNLRTGGVCGVVRRSRDVGSDLGARAIPARTVEWLVETRFKSMRAENQRYHKNHPTWVSYLTSLEFEQSLGQLTVAQLLEHNNHVDRIQQVYSDQLTRNSGPNTSMLALIISRVLADFPVESLTAAGLRRGERISELYLVIAEFIDQFEALCDEIVRTFISAGADADFYGSADRITRFQLSAANRKLRRIFKDMQELNNSLHALLQEDSALRNRLEAITRISSEIIVVEDFLGVMLNERFYDFRDNRVDDSIVARYQELIEELGDYGSKLRKVVAAQKR
jgi:hypothetical protein